MSASIPPIGSFGRYEPLAELGAGAMGRVYSAHDPLIGRVVAIKSIRAEGLDAADREEFLARFRAEVRAAGRCAHPAIVAIHDFADDGATPYIVMEYVEGRTMGALLRERPLPPLTAAALNAAMLEVLDGLSVAHAQGVVHRDIKPGNIMITPNWRAKIADFGIARLVQGAGSQLGLTMVGGVVGTPRYMAPEQALGREVDHRADLFACAAILYEIATGQAPFQAPSMAETLLRLTSAEQVELGALADTPMGPLLRQGLAKDPQARFASAASFRLALAGALAAALGQKRAIPAADASRAAPKFEPALLERLREDLTVRLGPIADSMLRRAAEAAMDEATLLRSCAKMLADPAEREVFLRAHGLAPPKPAHTALGLSDAERAGAVAALAPIFGPIAPMMVRVAASRAKDREGFITLLCAEAAPTEAMALRRALAPLF